MLLLIFFICCGEAAEKKNGSVHFTLLSLLTILFVCFSAAKPQRKKWCSLTLLTIFLCVSLRRSRREKNGSLVVFTLHYLLYFCVFLCGEAAEKKMVVWQCSLHTTYYTILLCVPLRRSRREKMVVFTYTTYFAAQPQRKIQECVQVSNDKVQKKRKLALPPPFFC